MSWVWPYLQPYISNFIQLTTIQKYMYTNEINEKHFYTVININWHFWMAFKWVSIYSFCNNLLQNTGTLKTDT